MHFKFGGKMANPMANEAAEMIMPSLANIETSGNHIYFYDDVDESTILKLNKLIRDMTTALKIQSQNGLGDPCIYIHINSGGGSVLDAFAAVDTIMSCPVKVITIVEGCAASAATLLSLAGHYRYITEHSYMLIHQLSSAFWGKHNEFEDEMQNLNSFMKMIKDFYKQNTGIPQKNIDEILKHDLYFPPAQCVAYGLVDGIIKNGGRNAVSTAKPKPKSVEKSESAKASPKKSDGKKSEKKPVSSGPKPKPSNDPSSDTKK